MLWFVADPLCGQTLCHSQGTHSDKLGKHLWAFRGPVDMLSGPALFLGWGLRTHTISLRGALCPRLFCTVDRGSLWPLEERPHTFHKWPLQPLWAQPLSLPPWLTLLVQDVSFFPEGAKRLPGRPASTCDPYVHRSGSDPSSSCSAPCAGTGAPPRCFQSSTCSGPRDALLSQPVRSMHVPWRQSSPRSGLLCVCCCVPGLSLM